jgi:hypothetical protein
VGVPFILNIPLREQAENFGAWSFDTNGVFTEKSAYKILLSMFMQWNTQNKGHIHMLKWRGGPM